MKCSDISNLEDILDFENVSKSAVTNKQKIIKNLSSNILKELNQRGLGATSKADLETLIFHSIIENFDDFDEYAIMNLFKISPAKLRSLRLNESVKHFDLNLTSVQNLKKIIKTLSNIKFEQIDKSSGKIRLYVADAHTYRLMERFINQSGSSVDYQLNKNQMDVKYCEMILLIEQVQENLAKANDPTLTDFVKVFKDSVGTDISAETMMNDLDSFTKKFNDLVSKAKDDGIKFILNKSYNLIYNYYKNKFKP